jgi:hypothetical protein
VKTCLLSKGIERFVDVSGLAGHQENKLRIVTAQAVINTHKGPVIAIFRQMALLGKGKSILLCVQMEHFGANVNDKSLHLPGVQQRILVDGFQIPLNFHNGLPCLQFWPPTKEQHETLPNLIITSDIDWHPSSFYSTIANMDTSYNVHKDEVPDSQFNFHRISCHHTLGTTSDTLSVTPLMLIVVSRMFKSSLVP